MDSRFSYTEAPGSQNAAACAGFLLRAAPGVRRPGAPHRTSHDRQRLGLPQKPALRRRHEPDRRRAYIHPPLPAADQRQGRTLPPDPAAGLGLQTRLHQQPTNGVKPRPQTKDPDPTTPPVSPRFCEASHFGRRSPRRAAELSTTRGRNTCRRNTARISEPSSRRAAPFFTRHRPSRTRKSSPPPPAAPGPSPASSTRRRISRRAA